MFEAAQSAGIKGKSESKCHRRKERKGEKHLEELRGFKEDNRQQEM